MVRDEACAAALGAAILLGTAAPARGQTVTWFEQNPRERATVLRACEDDHGLAGTPPCLNARAAETRALARRLGRDAPLPSHDMAPFMRDAIRKACAAPEAQRGMFAPYCPTRL